MDLYLAHPFEMRYEVRDWEKEFESRNPVRLVNPFYDVAREDMRKFDEGLAEPRTIKTSDEGLYIVERDLELINRCDGLLAFITKDKESLGTPMEFFYSSRILRKPTYAITHDMDGHPWVRGLATEVFRTPNDFEKYIQTHNS